MRRSLCVFLAGCCLVVWARLAEANERPNIVVIISDDAGYNEFSLNGSTNFATPHIDSIAASGARFTEGYTSGTVCSPTRAGLMTGRYQNRFGHEFNVPPVYSETNGLPLSETTIADVMKAAGYRTIALGKCHLGYAPAFHPMSRGFTDYYGFLQGARSYFPLEKPTILNQLLRDREPVEESFDYMTDELGRAAAAYIADAKAEPFFMYLAFNATHGPNDATEADIAEVGDGPGNRTHRAMTFALDRAVGMVLDALETEGIRDNTLVIFVNDNGGVQGHDNTPLAGFKGSTWEGGIRVPFAISWPAKIPAGQVHNNPVITLDILPTAMAAAGVTQRPQKPLDGVDLLPWLTTDRNDRPHETLFWKNGTKWAVRDGDLKLVVSPPPPAGGGRRRQGGGTELITSLFDIPSDPAESMNLAAEQPGEVARLTAMYEDWSRDFPPTPWGPGSKE